MSLKNTTIANSYKDLLQLDNSNSGITTSIKYIKDGEGTQSCMAVSDDVLLIQPQNDDTSAAFGVFTSSTDAVLLVDTTNELVIQAFGGSCPYEYAIFKEDETIVAGS